MGFSQLLSEKTVTTLQSTALVAYVAHAVRLNASALTAQWLIGEGHTQVRSLPACST